MPKQILFRGSVPEAVGLDEKVGGGEVEATTFAEVAEVYIVARRSCPSAEIYDLHENFCCSKFGGKKCCRAVWTVPEAADSNKEAAGLLPGDDDQQQVDRGNLALPAIGFPSSGSGALFEQGMAAVWMREYFLPIVTFFREAACNAFLAVYVSNRLHTDGRQRGTQKKDTLMEQK